MHWPRRQPSYSRTHVSPSSTLHSASDEHSRVAPPGLAAAGGVEKWSEFWSVSRSVTAIASRDITVDEPATRTHTRGVRILYRAIRRQAADPYAAQKHYGTDSASESSAKALCDTFPRHNSVVILAFAVSRYQLNTGLDWSPVTLSIRFVSRGHSSNIHTSFYWKSWPVHVHFTYSILLIFSIIFANRIPVSITFFHLPATLVSFSNYVLPHLSLVQSHKPKSLNHF